MKSTSWWIIFTLSLPQFDYTELPLVQEFQKAKGLLTEVLRTASLAALPCLLHRRKNCTWKERKMREKSKDVKKEHEREGRTEIRNTSKIPKKTHVNNQTNNINTKAIHIPERGPFSIALRFSSMCLIEDPPTISPSLNSPESCERIRVMCENKT